MLTLSKSFISVTPELTRTREKNAIEHYQQEISHRRTVRYILHEVGSVGLEEDLGQNRNEEAAEVGRCSVALALPRLQLFCLEHTRLEEGLPRVARLNLMLMPQRVFNLVEFGECVNVVCTGSTKLDQNIESLEETRQHAAS